MEFKIQGDRLYTTDKWGNTQRFISENVSFAAYNENTKVFLVTTNDGEVYTRDEYGNSILRIFTSDAIDARFLDGDIMIRTRNGNRLVDKYGNTIRNL